MDFRRFAKSWFRSSVVRLMSWCSTPREMASQLLVIMHTEGVAFSPRKSPRARYAKSNILAQVLNQSVMYLKRRVESLAVCMPQLNNTCANIYAKDLTLNAGRQRLRCAWAISFMCYRGIYFTNRSNPKFTDA